jgi:hypothetical protein
MLTVSIIGIIVMLIMTVYWICAIYGWKKNEDSSGIMFGIPLSLMAVIIIGIILNNISLFT